MSNLLERLEAATGPNGELNAEIMVRLKFPKYSYPDIVLNRKPDSWREALGRLTHDGFGGGITAPNYTGSLDAALTLFPDNVVSYRISDGPGGPSVWLFLDDGTEIDGIPDPGKGTVKTACCIAALKVIEGRG